MYAGSFLMGRETGRTARVVQNVHAQHFKNLPNCFPEWLTNLHIPTSIM